MSGSERPERSQAILAAGLIAVAAAATLGDGGSHPTSLLVQHTLILAMVSLSVATGRPAGYRVGGGVALAFGGFVALAAAGAVIAPYAFAAWLVLVEILSFAAVAWLASRAGPSLLGRLATGLGVWAVASSIAAIAQRLSGAYVRPRAGFLNPTHFAAWLVAVGCLGGGALAAAGPRTRRFGVLAAIPVGAALLLTGSRGALAGIVAGTVVVVGASPGARSVEGRRRLGAVAAVFLVLSLAGVAWRMRVPDPNGVARPAIWRAALSAVAARPATGTGPGQFETASANLNFPREDRPLRYERSFAAPHSDLVRAPSEFGVPATLALALALGLGLRAVAAKRRRRELGALEIGALAALAALGAQGAFNDLTETPALYLLAAVLCGTLLASPAARGTGPPAAPRLARVAVLVVVGAAFLAGDVAPYLAWRASASDLDAAIGWNPFQPDLLVRRVNRALSRASGWTPEDYARAREDAERAVRLAPEWSVAWLAVAHVEGAACRALFGDVATRARAAEAFEAAQERSAHDPLLSLDAARFLLATGDPGGARRLAERALKIEPNAVTPRLVAAEALLAGGDGGERARALVDEGERLASRYADAAADSPYAHALLAPDAAELARVRAALDLPRRGD